MSGKRQIILLITGCLLFVFFWHYELILYGISQFKGQLNIIIHARPIDEFLKDKEISEVWKEKLLLIGKIKSFAVDSLGLLPTKNYTSIYDQKDKPVLWVLTGCRPFKFEAKTWWFPLIGNVSYKGFFKKQIGEIELQKLREEGFDADLSPTGGWSTLGWFKDPVLSNMLKKNDGVLSELIIHEILHGTIYYKSNVDFNENLATFIGEQGAEGFLKYAYGDSSDQLKSYLNYKSDEELFGNFLIASQHKLEVVYKDFNPKVTDKLKLKLKNQAIFEIILKLNLLPFHNKTRYHFSTSADSLPDNTFFMSNSRYRMNQQKMSELFKYEFKENLPAFISYLKNSNEEDLLKRLNK